MTHHQVNLSELRERAEQAIAHGEARLRAAGDAPPEIEFHRLVEELSIYQAELEIQNEDLSQSQSKTAQALEKYRLLFQYLPLPAFLVDATGFIQEASRQASDLLGLSRNTALQRGSLFQLFDFPSRDPLALALHGRPSPEPVTLNFLGLQLGPSKIARFDVHIMPLQEQSPQGRLRLVVLVDRSADLALRESEERYRMLNADLERQVAVRTAEVRATSAALRESEERFRLAFDNANTGMGLVDIAGKILKVNDKLSAILGWSKRDLEGMAITDLVLPEDRELRESAMRLALAGVQESVTMEIRYRHHRGHTIYAQVAASLARDEAGNPRYFISEIEDITARKQAEEQLRISAERYRWLAERAGDCISVLDLDGRYTYVSPAVERLRGYSPAEVMEQTLEEVLTPEGAAAVHAGLARIRAALAEGLPLPELRGEFQQRHKDGSAVWTEITLSGMQSASGDYLGTLACSRQISDPGNP